MASLSPLRARRSALSSELSDGFQVGQHQLGVDRVDVADRVDGALDVDDVGVLEAADDVQDRVHLADVREELVAQPFAGAGAADDAGDVDHAQRRRG